MHHTDLSATYHNNTWAFWSPWWIMLFWAIHLSNIIDGGGKNIVSRFLTVVYWDVHCSGLNLQTYSDLYKGYCFLCCVECKGRGSVWCEETNFFLSNLYPNTGSAGDCVWVHSVIQKAHSRFTQSKWSVFWWPEWTSDLSLLASGFFFFLFLESIPFR